MKFKSHFQQESTGLYGAFDGWHSLLVRDGMGKFPLKLKATCGAMLRLKMRSGI